MIKKERKKKLRINKEIVEELMERERIQNKNTKEVYSNPISNFQHLTSDHRAITLVALIITIIVMIILVAVTISIAINGRLFTIAQESATNTMQERNKEEELSVGKIEINGNTYDSIDDYIKSYTELEYLESDALAYIDTNVRGNNDSLSFEVEYSWVSLPQSQSYRSVFSNYRSELMQGEANNVSRIVQFGENQTYININCRARSISTF